MPLLHATRQPKVVTALVETFGFSRWLATAVALLLGLLAGAAVLWVVLSAPPRTITITSGPPGSSFERYAQAYSVELRQRGITLKILPSGGSLDNLERIKAEHSGVDFGFVLGGLVGDNPPDGLVSLGSVNYQPVWLFYRGTARINRLSELAGKRVGIGADGSGVQAMAHALLEANGITGPPTTLVEQDSAEQGKEFQAGNLDAVFLMGDSAPVATLRALLRADDVQLYNVTQADAYLRRLKYLNKIVLPQGAIDLGRNVPAQDVVLVGPAVELVARESLNSTISDLLIEVAQKVHGGAGLAGKRGEFPSPLERDFPISKDALRFYKSGKGITYELVKVFWLASLINRLLVAIVPIALVLIPTIRLLPVVYRWSVQVRIYRCYRPLLRLERDAGLPLDAEQSAELMRRLDLIESQVNGLKVPASFASQYYDLRNHVVFVRQRLKAATA